MGLKAVANPAAGGQPGSFTTLTVTGAATIGGGLAVTGSISATDNATFKTVSSTGQISAVANSSIVLDMNGVDTGRILSANSGGTFTTPINVVNPMSFTSFLQGAEETAPTAPAANGYRIFAQDNGAGKTQLMVIFATGAAQQIAIEP